MQFRPDRASSVLALGKKSGRNDNVGVYRPKGNSQCAACFLSPGFGRAQRIFVANYKSRTDFITESNQTVLGKAAQNKSDISSAELRRNFRNRLIQKTVVAQVRVGIKRNGCEKDHDGFPEGIGSVNRNGQGWIIDSPLGPLHPIHHACSVRIGRARTANRDSRIMGDLGEEVQDLSISCNRVFLIRNLRSAMPLFTE